MSTFLIIMSSAVSELIEKKLLGGDELINKFEKPLLGILVLVIMFGMGATLSIDDFKNIAKRPKGIIVGFLSQFGFMPMVAFAISVVLDLDPQNAIALIMIGCLPAGSTSNMFSYFSRGDLALSISMTSASTLAAIVMTPLLLSGISGWDFDGAGSFMSFTDQINEDLRAKGGETSEFKVPVKDIVVSLFVVMIPVAGGMFLRSKSQGWAKAAEDTAGFAGIIVIVFLLISVVVRHADLLIATDWKIYAASILVGLAGFKFGYLFSWLIKCPPRWRRTISLETGIQNGPLAFAVVILTFSPAILITNPGTAFDAMNADQQAQTLLMNQMLWLPILYSAFIVLTSTIVTLIYRKVGKTDYELYENETVQKELFGPHYRQGMSGPVAAQ